MRTFLYSLALGTIAVLIVSCQENKQVIEVVEDEGPELPVWTFNNNSVELGTPDFRTFGIALDYSELKERVHTDSVKKSYVENFVFNDSVEIVYNGNKAVVNGGSSNGFTVQMNGAHVTITTTKDLACSLKGRSDNGSLMILGDNKIRINLNGVNLKNTNGPAINNRSNDQCFIVTDSMSVLSDDTLYAEVEEEKVPKGCVCSKGKLYISGRAPLKIVANGADAIHSGKSIFVRRGTNIDIESHAHHAIKAKNNVRIEGGVMNITSTGRAGHGISAQKKVEIAGGRTTIISDTGYGKERKNSRGIKSDSLVAITGGIVRIKESSVGGKGIRAGEKFLAQNCIVDVLTFGNDDKVSGSKNKGIKGFNELKIDSARVRVRCVNGYNEAIESRKKVIINNSLVELTATDDAISAGNVGEADIEVTNGRIFIESGNDALDSNGTIHIHSGLMFITSLNQGGRGFDCDEEEFLIGPQSTIVSLGHITSPPTVGLLEHPMFLTSRFISEPDFCLATTGKDDNLINFKVPEFRIHGPKFKIMVSLPEFKEEASYDFCQNATVKPQHTFHGLQLGGTAASKEVKSTHKLMRKYQVF